MKEIYYVKLKSVIQYDKNYMIYCFRDKESYKLYLKHKDYGVMMLMIGAPIKQQSLEELLRICDIESYIQEYKEDYED